MKGAIRVATLAQRAVSPDTVACYEQLAAGPVASANEQEPGELAAPVVSMEQEDRTSAGSGDERGGGEEREIRVQVGPLVTDRPFAPDA